MEMVKIPKEEYEQLKIKSKLANVDMDLLIQFIEGLKDVKEGRVTRVK